ncbi:hypothetical protein TrVFT333_002358 [Trichoderma virens FT-333]|nr:hypothetical protein TrVFT333_002358 [Trichoderma virens FT-333]
MYRTKSSDKAWLKKRQFRRGGGGSPQFPARAKHANCEKFAVTDPNLAPILHSEEHILKLERRVLALETERGPELTSRAHLRDQARCNAQPNQAIPNQTLRPGTKATYEGESSFAEQAIQAHRVAGLIADTRGTLQLDHSFSTLNMLLGQSGMPAASSSGALPAMSSLPVELVTSIVKEIKKKAPIFMRSWVLDDVSLVQKLCQDLYFPTEPLSVGHLTSAYGILHAICKEFWLTKHPLCKSFDLGVQVATCEQNFDAGLQTYEIVSQPSFLTILALTLGIDASQADHAEIFELSKGHWKLIYLSTETLILRAPSTGDARAEISSKCLQVARECLYSNIECFESYRNHGIISENEYANSRLVPLEQTVGIVQKMQDASPEVSRLYQICSAFLRLASDFMKPGVTQSASLDSPNNLILQPNEVSWQTLLQPDFLRELLGAELIGTQAGAMALGQEFDVPSNVI